MFDAWGISIFVGFDFHNVDALRLKSRKELRTLFFRKLLILRIYSINVGISSLQRKVLTLYVFTFASEFLKNRIMETKEYFEKEMFFENLPVLPYP